MTNYLSRFFDSFSRGLFDYSTLFPHSCNKVSLHYLSEYYLIYIVPFNTIDQIRTIQLAVRQNIFKIFVNVITGGHVKV
jgi:hypothetical protein